MARLLQHPDLWILLLIFQIFPTILFPRSLFEKYNNRDLYKIYVIFHAVVNCKNTLINYGIYFGGYLLINFNFMNYYKRIFALGSIITLLLCVNINAQNPAINTDYYKNAFGLRAGGTSGLTIKHFTNSNTALEGIVGFWPYTINITGLYEKYAHAGASGLSWYYGGGGHISFISATYYDRDYYYYRNYYRERGLGMGIDGIVGIEYKIRPIPFAISIDLKPMIEVYSFGGSFFAIDPGLGIKLTF